MDTWYSFRVKKPFIRSDRSTYGGLYTTCYLPEYRIPFSYTIRPAEKSATKNINLYVFCDSYLYYSTQQSYFYGVDTFVKIRWWVEDSYKKIRFLNKDKHNILVLEMTERFVRDICTNDHGITSLLRIDTSLHDQKTIKTAGEPNSFDLFLQKHLFNPNLNSNLELNLFDYGLFRPLKELKAQFNYKIFNRVNKDVFVDTAKNFLYYMPTVQEMQKMNAFYPLDSTELPLICRTLNNVYDYYKMRDFEEVYFAVIPNPVTMVNPHLARYNNLIPSLYAVDSLRMKMFDIYSVFAHSPQNYYSRNDTHWNSQGLQTWLDNFNKILKETSMHALK